MTYKFKISTYTQGYHSITHHVKQALAESNIKSGLCVVYCPHTTAAITINENADPDVVRDMVVGFDSVFPHKNEYKHFEGNTTAHLKCTTVGVSQTIIVQNGSLILGTWQGIYFCEFDGPRDRTYYVKFLEG